MNRPGARVWFDDRDLGRINVADLDRHQLKQMRQNMQMIFQDPCSSLNPRMTLLQIVGRPLYVNGIAKGSNCGIVWRICSMSLGSGGYL